MFRFRLFPGSTTIRRCRIRDEIAMGRVNIKNGTPVAGAHLCLRCSWAQAMTGYRESDRLVVCNKTSPDMVVPFVMLDCSGFDDKHRPTWNQMEKLAIRVPARPVSARTKGFATAAEARPAATREDGEDEESEAALAG
jgi:hypothetical protein